MPSRRPYGTPFNLSKKIRTGSVRVKGRLPALSVSMHVDPLPWLRQLAFHRRWMGWSGDAKRQELLNRDYLFNSFGPRDDPP